MGKDEKLVNFFFEVGSLRKLMRSYHLEILEDTESVAEHSHRAMTIAYVLAKKVGADAHKAMLMAAFHDMPETRTGDSNWVQKSYLIQDEERALSLQLANLSDFGDELQEILKEYKERKSLESHVAKDADYIEYFCSLKEMELKGNKEASRRLKSENTSLDHMYTKEGKKLARIVKKTNPIEWTKSDLKKSHGKYTLKK